VCARQSGPLKVMETAHRGVTGVETRTNEIIAKLPVDRGAGDKFEGFKFNAWSPLLRKFKVDGNAEGDVVTKNHAGYPLSWLNCAQNSLAASCGSLLRGLGTARLI